MSSVEAKAGRPHRFRELLRHYYEGDSPEAQRFRYALLVFDLATVLFIVISSFLPRTRFLESVDLVLGVVILADFAARLTASRNVGRDLIHPATWADVAAIVSFLAPVVGEGAGFLRVLRTLRLLHTYQLVQRLRADSPFFRRHEELILSTVHLGVFLFIMSAIVYETQRWTNPGIGNYVDALYFTVTTLNHDGLRRHYPARDHGAADLGRHHDLRRDAFPAAGAGPAHAA